MIQLIKYLYGLLWLMLVFGLLTIVAIGFAYGFEKVVDKWPSLLLLIAGIVICIVLANYGLKRMEAKVQ